MKELQDKSEEQYKGELAQKRAEIDALDEQIVKAVTARMEIAREIALMKAERGEALFDASRESLLVERVVEMATQSGMTSDDAEEIFGALYSTLLQQSKEYQRKRLIQP